MSGVAVVFGLCALSFAAGCVLTAVMLRREPPPEPAPEPETERPAPRFEARFPLPSEDYATRPIHRNAVMGLPTALPAPSPTRPNLVVVPDPEPTELPVRQDAARRMHVVRTGPAPAEPSSAEPVGDSAQPAVPVGERAEPAEPVDPPPTALDAARRESNR